MEEHEGRPLSLGVAYCFEATSSSGKTCGVCARRAYLLGDVGTSGAFLLVGFGGQKNVLSFCKVRLFTGRWGYLGRDFGGGFWAT